MGYARPPFALEHLLYHIAKPRPDGPSALVLTPLELIDKIACRYVVLRNPSRGGQWDPGLIENSRRSDTCALSTQAFGDECQNESIQTDAFCLCSLSQLRVNGLG